MEFKYEIKNKKAASMGADSGHSCGCASKEQAQAKDSCCGGVDASTRDAAADEGSCCGTGHDHGQHAHGGHVHSSRGQRNMAMAAAAAPSISSDEVIDPVCGMTVNAKTTRHKTDYKGQTYYFCAAGCKAKFVANPAKYLAAEKPVEPVVPGAIYTCPMHPQIQQVGPGTCPICGMALEPLVATVDSGPNHELADMKLRLWIGAALSLPVLVLAMSGAMLGIVR